MNIFEKLKIKWGITSNWQLLIIFFVFAITGSSSLWVAKPVLNFLGINKESLSPWAFWPLRILIVLPVYQALLIIYGTLLGQFKFFWNFEKKMFSRFVPKKREKTAEA